MRIQCTNEIELKRYFDKIFLFDKEIPYVHKELLGNASILRYKLKLQNKNLILYGAGKIGFITLVWLKMEGIQVEFIVDRDENKNGKELLGIPIVNLSQFDKKLKNGKKYMLLSTILDNDTKKFLYHMGVEEIVDVCIAEFHTYPSDISELYIYNSYYEFLKVFEILEDYQSKKILCESLRCRLYDDVYRLFSEPSREKYFGEGIFKQDEEEVLLCLGGNNGDTLFYFLDKYKNFEAAILFEPENIEKLMNNLNILPQKIKNKIELVDCYASDFSGGKNIKIDDWIGNRKVSLITMDIEGMEAEALEGAKSVIKKQKPILALSAYHKWDDLIVFTKLILSISCEYHFYLRKYGALISMNRNEIVLYAVPTNRLIKI